MQMLILRDPKTGESTALREDCDVIGELLESGAAGHELVVRAETATSNPFTRRRRTIKEYVLRSGMALTTTVFTVQVVIDHNIRLIEAQGGTYLHDGVGGTCLQRGWTGPSLLAHLATQVDPCSTLILTCVQTQFVLGSEDTNPNVHTTAQVMTLDENGLPLEQRPPMATPKLHASGTVH